MEFKYLKTQEIKDQKVDELIKSFANYQNFKNQVGNEWHGWMKFPFTDSSKSERIRILNKVNSWHKEGIKDLVVIGIGGSYLGSLSLSSLLKGYSSKTDYKLHYAGINLSDDYHQSLMNDLKGKKFAIVVISKSGTTMETAIVFNLMKQFMTEQKIYNKPNEYIVAITDLKKGKLNEIATKEGYEMFEVPNDVGGRFSVLTAVGIFPLAFIGCDVESLVSGALEMQTEIESKTVNHSSFTYALNRVKFYNQTERKVEIYESYEPRFSYLMEWIKQLMGESEGKSKKGLFPASINLTADLHSLGQFVQDGTPIFFQTLLKVKNPPSKITIFKNATDVDFVPELSNKELTEVNGLVSEAVLNAHNIIAKTPHFQIEIDSFSEKEVGKLVQWFFNACMVSSYLFGVNPFDQPGVETYKAEVRKLLSKKA